METLLKVCALSLAGMFTVNIIKRTLPEMSAAATLALITGLVAVAAGTVGKCVMFIYELAENAGISGELVTPLIKCVGVSILTKIGGDMCRDNGMSAVASYIELVGGAVAISIAMPLMLTVLKQIT